MRYFCWLILVVLCAAAGARAAVPAPILQYELIGLEGSLQQNALAWLGAAPLTPQDRLSFLVSAEQRLEDSLKALGYYNADISISVKRTEPVWSMRIKVIPGAPVLITRISIKLLGEAAGDARFEHLLEQAPFREGDVFSHGDYERFKNRLLTLGQERGYFDASFKESRVEVNPVADSAAIYLHYDSGVRYRFGAVDYSEIGIEPELLHSLQPFREGDYFDQSKLQLFQAQLQRTRYFSGVLLRPEFARAKDYRVPLSVKLHPARRHGFDVGFGYSTDTLGRVSFTWRTPLLNRYGHSQETRIAYSEINPSGRFTYSIPLGDPLNDVLHLSALLENNKFGDVDSVQEQLGVQREIRGERWLFSYTGRVLQESWELKNTKFNNSYTLPGFALSRSSRGGSVVDPSSGFNQFYKLEGGSDQLGSDIDLLRLTAKFSYIMTPEPAHRIVTRASLGSVFLSDSDRINLAPSLRFFAGGSQSIRGYGYQSVGTEIEVTRDDGSRQKLVVGGDRLVTGTLEYQYYFTDTWRGALFVDAGDAFDSDDIDLQVGPGFGIHYLSPVGAVRLEFANGISEDDPSWRMHLNIGAEF